MSYLKNSVFILLVLLLVSSVFSAEKPKFGKITDEEWALEPPAQYPNANAVIVFDIGEARLHLFKYRSTRHCRIKIFSKDGADDITQVEIPIGYKEKVKGLKAHTITPDGKKIEVKEFFDKSVNDMKIISFTFPAIEDGSIVEYTYKTESSGPQFPEWTFQHSAYTMRSRFTYFSDDNISYEIIYFNIPIQIRRETEERMKNEKDFGPVFDLEMKNLMPAEDEPLMGARSAFISSILLNPTSIIWHGQYVSLVTSRNERGKQVYSHMDSQYRHQAKKYKHISDSLCAGVIDDNERIKVLYDFMTNEIITDNDVKSIDDIADLMSGKRAGRYDKCVALIGLLRSQGFPAKALYIGTRDKVGRLNPQIQSMFQFNRVLCYIDNDSSGITLDPGERYVDYPYVPVDDLVEQGLIIDSVNSRLISLHFPKRKSGKGIANIIHIERDGSAICSTMVYISGYSMIPWKKKLADSLSDEKIVEELLGDAEYEYEITFFSCKEDTAMDRLRFDMVLTIPEFASSIDSNLFFSPTIVPIAENPFSKPHRTFPVDFRYKFTNRCRTQVYLSEGMEVSDIPLNIIENIRGAKYSRNITAAQNMMSVKADLYIDKAYFDPSEYSHLKKLFGIMSESCLDQVTAVPVSPAADGRAK